MRVFRGHGLKVYLTHKIALKPTKQQEVVFQKALGLARFAHNWGLTEWMQSPAGKKPSVNDLSKKLTAIKRTQFPWMFELPACIVTQAIWELGSYAHPDFKRKGINESARLDSGPGTFAFHGKKIRLPRIGWVKMTEALRLTGLPRSVTLKHLVNRWFVFILVEVPSAPPVRENQAAVVIDCTATKFITLSDTEQIAVPTSNVLADKVKRLTKAYRRKQKGSANKRKAKQKLDKLYAHVANVKLDHMHKFTTKLVDHFGVIWLKNEKLPVKNQLIYKMKLAGGKIYQIDSAVGRTVRACGEALSR